VAVVTEWAVARRYMGAESLADRGRASTDGDTKKEMKAIAEALLTIMGNRMTRKASYTTLTDVTLRKHLAF
jgi:hypothetical protein